MTQELGHDIGSMEATFEKAKKYPGPCVIHVLTKKGYGYEQAEAEQVDRFCAIASEFLKED